MPKVCLMCGESFSDSTTFCPRDGSALRAAVKGDDLIGELVGERYLITDLISHGGMGSVYVASDVRLPQQFAVKVLKEQMSPDPAVIQRFRQEAEAVCRINHDRVARVFDFGFMEDGRAYIIMEYAKGRTLRDVMDDRAPLDMAEAARITTMMAEGLDAAHRLGIVHRDLKPENVMILDDAGGGMRLKVLDFGIAKLMDTEAGKGYTQPGFVIGTPIWMSPEQLSGDVLDARSDVYSLALLAYAMMTGHRPFVGETEQIEMLARLAATPRRLAEVAPHIAWPDGLQDIFDRTLSREINDRPSSAISFSEAVTQAVPARYSRTPAAAFTPDALAAQGVSSATPGAVPSVNASRTPRSSGALGTGSGSSGVVAGNNHTAFGSSRSKLFMFGGGIGVAAAAIIAVVMLRPFGGGEAVPALTPMEADSSAAPATAVPGLAGAGEVPNSATGDTTMVVVDASTGGATATSMPPTTSSAAGSPPRTVPRSVEPPVPIGGATPPTGAAGTSARTDTPSKALERIMRDYDDTGGTATVSRITISKIAALLPDLRVAADRAYAQLYLGMSHATLKDQDEACAAFERAGSLGSASVKKDSDDWRLTLRCRP